MSNQYDKLQMYIIVFLPLGAMATDTATLTFNLAAAGMGKMWDIKVTQVRCGMNAYESLINYIVALDK